MAAIPDPDPGSFGHIASALGDDGKDFELLCRWLLGSHPRFADQVRDVFLWSHWPERDGPDDGIDLVVLDTAGELWAVQCKHYAPQRRVTKPDVDSFLAASADRRFSRRLLMTTSRASNRNALRSLRKQPERRVETFRLADFEQASVRWPASLADLRPTPARRIVERPHQRLALDEIVGALERGGRAQVRMACGTGKTLVAIRAADRLSAELTCIAVPSLALMAQTIDAWRDQSSAPFDWLAVCSEHDIGDDGYDPADLAQRPTTDPEAIAAFLHTPGRRVLFTTYHSSTQIAAAYARSPDAPAVELLICDEAHWAAGDRSSPFATVLDSSAIAARRRLFLTATPRAFGWLEQERAREHGGDLASMDDASLFGRVVYRLSFGEAIDAGLLADYRIVVAVVDDAQHLKRADHRTLMRGPGGRLTDAGTLAAQALVLRAIERWNLRRLLTFHHRVTSAQAFAGSLPATAEQLPVRDDSVTRDLWATHVSARTSPAARAAVLARLNSLDGCERALVASVAVLSEGVDVPAVDAVAILDPKRSVARIVQIVGRALRTGGNPAKVATIVVPVFLANHDDVAAHVDGGAFEPVLNVLHALRAHDERLAQELDDLRVELGPRPRLDRLPDRVHLDLEDLATPVSEDFLGAFRAHVIKATAPSLVRLNLRAPEERDEEDGSANTAAHDYAIARRGLDLLEHFVKGNRHARVPLDHVDEDGFPLGGWLTSALHSVEREHDGRVAGLFSHWNAMRFEELVSALDLPLGRYPALERHLAQRLRSLVRFRATLAERELPAWAHALATPPPLELLTHPDAAHAFDLYVAQYESDTADETYELLVRGVDVVAELASALRHQSTPLHGTYAAGFCAALKFRELRPDPGATAPDGRAYAAGIRHGAEFRRFWPASAVA